MPFSVIQQVQLAAGVWTDITSDTDLVDGLHIKYGIDGNGPTDCVAGTGECSSTLDNWATSGRLQGSYSPLHTNCRTGWTFGVPLRVVFTDGADAALAITSITRTGAVATVTTTAPHGYSDGWATIAGAVETDYNGVHQITVTGGSTFTYAVANAPSTPATGTKTTTRAYVKHRGKVRVINPDAGRYGTQRVHVVSYDGMRDLAEADVRSLAIVTGQTETALITDVLNAVVTEAQPVARDLDVGVDTMAYAFHDLGEGEKALGLINDVAVDAYALVAMRGDGTLILRNRHTRITGASVFTFNETMSGFEAPTDLTTVYNDVRVTICPPTIDAAATTVIYSDQAVRAIAAGETSEFWVSYRNPTESRTLIGGDDVVTPLVANTDYAGNSLASGAGADLTASLAVTVTPFGSTALCQVTNNHATSTIYLVTGAGAPFFQIRGKGVYELAPQTYTATSVQSYGTRPLAIKLRYQSDAGVAQSYADFIEAQRHGLGNQPQSLEFIANDSPSLITVALSAEPGDQITVTETMTGFTLVDAIVQSCALDVTQGDWLTCRFGLAPANTSKMWIAGIAGVSEAGTTTIPGF